MKQGYIYALSNESMPGLIKIGKSKQGSHGRAMQLYTTGVPTKFKLVFEIFVENMDEIEISVHENLSKYRVNDKREFFKCSEKNAIRAILEESISYHDLYPVHEEYCNIEIDLMCIASRCGVDSRTLVNALSYLDDDSVRYACEELKERMKKYRRLA